MLSSFPAFTRRSLPAALVAFSAITATSAPAATLLWDWSYSGSGISARRDLHNG